MSGRWPKTSKRAIQTSQREAKDSGKRSPAGPVSEASPDILADIGYGSLNPQQERTRLDRLESSP